MSDRTCGIEECDRSGKLVRGWCKMHYTRWERHGDPLGGGPPRISAPDDGLCSIEGCAAQHYGRGWCRMHYTRWKRNGDPNKLVKPGNSYNQIHLNLKTQRGSASRHNCEHCRGTASEWAYDHNDPKEHMASSNGCLCPCSLDPLHYIPLCKPCHRKFDWAWRTRRSS